MGIRFIEFENRRKTLDGTAEGGASDWAGEFEMGGKSQIGISVEVDGGLTSRDEGGAIGWPR